MILAHNGKKPRIDPTAYVAPSATVCGDVSIGAHCRIMFGACLIAEGGSIELGTHCIVLENAVIRKHIASFHADWRPLPDRPECTRHRLHRQR